MSRDRKCYHPGSCIEVCFRVEEGLPLVAAPYMRVVIESILARAQTFYPVRIFAAVVLGNHMHLHLGVQNPADITRWKEYTKRELSHAINRFLGRRNRTVFADGSDDMLLLDPPKVIERLVYLYTNPQKADLVATIDSYPNFVTWQAFLDGGAIISTRRIARTAVTALPARMLSNREQQRLADQLLSEGLEEYQLVIEPDGWLDCFPQMSDADPELIRDEVVARIRHEERCLNRSRRKPVLGAHALVLQSMRKRHTPKKFGRRMLCVGSSRIVVQQYVSWRKALHEECSRRYRRWCLGETDVELPPGAFWPGGRLSSPCEVLAHAFC